MTKKQFFPFHLSLITILLLFGISVETSAETGSRLWLRSEKVNSADAPQIKTKRTGKSVIAKTAENELRQYWRGCAIRLEIDRSTDLGDGFRIACSGSPAAPKDSLITLSASSPQGLLYGAYELLRCQSMGSEISCGDHRPTFGIRILNHWDNLDGSVERGYAGKSIWKWEEITSSSLVSSSLRQHIIDYARANASIGINGTVINNVNASPQILAHAYINKVKAIADILRPYGIRVYLSVNFASPIALDSLATADPLDPDVSAWWATKVKEIYAAIPDFGGFLVKANSEGQPGPGDYGRTHADGANMLADALRPYGGIVMWRCFVYGNHKGEDRVKQAVSEFKPVDGQFRDNVILQAKNGPLDFQPREPYAPVFDQIVNTPMMGELQITQEYLGQSRHLVYLAPMWKEFFSFVSPARLKGIAGVANIGDDTNWCGHHFSQANWYAFGRLAWNADLSSDSIAREWIYQTFNRNPASVEPIAKIMDESREACVNYMMPLGLHHIFKADHHYGPEPDGNQPHFPEEWKPVYYHKADSVGIGFDRSSRGTDAVSQYRAPYDTLYDDLSTCPEEYLLWFHHVPWTHTMRSGRTLWEEMNYLYDSGVASTERFLATWQQMRPYIDAQRYEEVESRLQHQVENAKEWRNVCLDYFGKIKKE